ncbi:MAG: ABC transporter substrate-binding protein [Clostridia bacterium]|nr:ABC transporter substrate-binding protein [Clostridia bacterium]
MQCKGVAYFFLYSVTPRPVLGDNSGKRSMNPEEVIKAAPDFILHMADLHDGNLEKVEEMQAQLNIPIVIIDSDMNKMDETFRFIGALIGAEEQAEKLATYTRTVIDDINAKAASIPEDQRVSVYYAEGEDGLQTDPEGSDHSRAFTAVNAKNAAEIEDFDAYYGRVTVSMEQIMEWDPEYVVFCPDDSIFAEGVASICQDLMDGKEVGSWNSLNAVKNNKFFEAPYGLANAIDRPATINLVYGYQWVGNLLYPEVFDYDMNKVTKEFYSLFYHYDMSDEEVAKLLSRASER